MLYLFIALGYIYLGLRLTSQPWHWVILLLPFLSVFAFRFFRENLFLVNISFCAMGLLTYLLLFTLLRDFLLLFKIPPLATSGILFLTVFTFLIGSMKATLGIRTMVVDVPVRNLPDSLEGLKIVQVSDLHIGPTIGQRFVRKVVHRVNFLEPDIVALTGDIGDGLTEVFRPSTDPLKDLKSRFGIYYVPGNHEYYADAEAWMDMMKEMGMEVLVNDGRIVNIQGEDVLIGGVPDPASGESRQPESALKLGEGKLKILLSHRPDIADEADRLGYDLTLAGHTHGGQFFPWTIVAWRVHRYFVGLYQLSHGHIYVSPGTGSWGPLLRLGSTPEITLLRLRKL